MRDVWRLAANVVVVGVLMAVAAVWIVILRATWPIIVQKHHEATAWLAGLPDYKVRAGSILLLMVVAVARLCAETDEWAKRHGWREAARRAAISIGLFGVGMLVFSLLLLSSGCGDGDMAKRLRPGGLWTDSSPDDAPDGALLQATNVVLRRAGLAEPRPGFSALDISGDVTADGVRGVFPFDGHRILALEDAGEWSLASYEPGVTSPSGLTEPWVDPTNAMVAGRMHSAEAAGSLFLTSEEGVLRFDSGGDTTPVFAGLPQALQPYVTLSAGTPAWLGNGTTGEATAYRVVYVRVVGEREVVSAPSPRTYAATVSAMHVEIAIPLAADLVAGDRVEVYRSQLKTNDRDVDPTDEMRKRWSATLTSGDVAAGEILWLDFLDDDEWTGASLYTNETQEGILRSNAPVPSARDVVAFQQMVFFGGARTRQRATFSFRAGSAADNYDETIQRVSFTGDVTLGSNIITNISIADGRKLSIGQRVSDIANLDPGAADAVFPAGTEIVSVTAISATVNNNALSTSAAHSLAAADWIAVDGVKYYATTPGNTSVANRTIAFGFESGDLAYVINSDSTIVHAYDVRSNQIIDATSIPVSLTLERRNGLSTTFDVTTTKPNAVDVIMDSTTAYESRREGSDNTLRWTKLDQPDHAPLIFQARVGNGDPILRIIPTRASLMIFKPDGVWRLAGESPEALRLDEHDQSVRLLHPDLAIALDNVVWAATERGIVAVSDGGVDEISNPSIAATIAPLLAQVRDDGLEGPGYFAASDQPNSEVIFGLSGAAVASEIYVFNAKSEAWSKWDLSEVIGDGEAPIAYAAAYDAGTTSLVLGVENQGSIPYIMESRAGVGSNGTYDQSIAVTISSVVDNGDGTNTLGISTSPFGALKVGDAVVQSSRRMIIESKSGSDYTGAVINGPFVTGAATGYRSFESVLQWRDFAFGDPDTNKFWTDATIKMERLALVREFTQSFVTDMTPAEGSFVREVPFLLDDVGPIRLRAMPTLEHRRGGAMRPGVTIRQAAADWALSGLHVRASEMDQRMGRGSYR